jgi:hypothetical protein
VHFDRARDLGQGLGLAGIGRVEEVQLRASALLAVGSEQQTRSVRRPSRLEIIARPAGQLPNGSVGDGDQTDPM